MFLIALLGCKKNDPAPVPVHPVDTFNVTGNYKIQSNKIETYNSSNTLTGTENLTPTDDVLTIMSDKYEVYSPSGRFAKQTASFSVAFKDNAYHAYFGTIPTDRTIMNNVSDALITKPSATTIVIVSTYGTPKKVQTITFVNP